MKNFFFLSVSFLAATILNGCARSEIRTENTQETAVKTPEQPKVAPSQTAQKNAPTADHSEASAEYHFSLAQAYVAEGNPDRAIEEFKATLMYDPNSALVYARLATEYIKKGMLSAAMETCKEALQRDPNFTDARLILAGLYSAAHDNASALTEYDRILRQDPNHEEAAVYKSQVLVEDGQIAESVKTLHQFLKKNSDSALGFYYLGRAEERQDHFKEAVIAYRKAIDAHPGFTQAALALGFLYEGKQMIAQATAVYQELFDDSQDISAANRLATIYLKEEKYKKAIPYLEAIQASDPDDMNVRVKLGLVEMELKQFDQAIGTFKGILAKNPDSDRIHYYLGSLYEELKQSDNAIAELKQVHADSKLFQDSALHVGYLLKEENHVDDAKAFMTGAITQSPQTSSFYLFQASLEEDTKNYDGAISVLESAVKRFPDDEKIRYYLGSLYDHQGDSDRGIAQMEEILKVNPENVDALNYVGYTWTQKGVRLTEAETLLKRALGLKPNNGYIQDSWGWYLFVRGRTHEAVVQLEKAAKLKPNEPTILEHLGDAYLKANLREKALQKYSDAAKFAQESNENKLAAELQAKVDTLKTELTAKSGASSARMPASDPQNGE